MVVTPCDLVLLILGGIEYTVAVSGIKCEGEKVVVYIEAVSGNGENSA